MGLTLKYNPMPLSQQAKYAHSDKVIIDFRKCLQ